MWCGTCNILKWVAAWSSKYLAFLKAILPGRKPTGRARPMTRQAEQVASHGGMDQLLFHYTSKETALEHILPTMRLRMSPYNKTRDPRENTDWSEMFGASHSGPG